MLLRTFKLFLFVADLLGVLTWQSRAGDPGHISGLNGSDEWFVALADNTHHLHLVGLKKIQRKFGNLYVEDVGIMVWHGSPFDNSVDLFLVFSEILRMRPRCCLGTSTESHQKASRSSASKWRSYLGKKKTSRLQTVSTERTVWISMMDIHCVAQRLQSQTMRLLPKWRQQPQLQKMFVNMEKMHEKCKKQAMQVILWDQHHGHSTGCAARLPHVARLRSECPSRTKSGTMLSLSNTSRLCFRWL